MITPALTGIVLAGGRSSRMGSDKSMMLFRNKPLIMHAIDTLRIICSKVVISANSNQYQFTGCETWHDEVPLDAPIAGIYTCLKRSETEWNVVLSCDMPLIDNRLIIELLTHCHDQLVIFPVHDKNAEPLCALYSKRAYGIMEEQIAQKQYGLLNFFKNPGCLPVDCNTLEFYRHDTFMNINTPDDFDLLNQT